MKKLTALFLGVVLLSAPTSRADDDKKEKDLPPGLRKKDKLPPGWEKKQREADKKQHDNERAVESKPVAAPANPGNPTPAAAPAPAAKNRSPQELKTDLENRIRIVNALDNKAAAFKTGMSAVANETGVPVAKIQEQHRTHPTAGLAGLMVANEIAVHTKKSITPYIRQHITDGKGWHEIAKANGVDIATLNKKLERVEQAILQK